MKERLLWRLIAISSLLAIAAMLYGLGLVAKQMWLPAEHQPPPPQSETAQSPGSSLDNADEIRIVALGDSLTKGVGDSAGKGFVNRLTEGLKTRFGKPVTLLNNLGVSGLRANELADRLQQDGGYRKALQQANLILLSIGGNDLFLAARAAVQAGQGLKINMNELTDGFDESLEHFSRVVEEVARLNPSAHVVVVGLYNPFYGLPAYRAASLTLQEWNKEVYGILFDYPQMRLVPTFDLFEARTADRLSADRFHPGAEGYEAIAARLLESLN